MPQARQPFGFPPAQESANCGDPSIPADMAIEAESCLEAIDKVSCETLMLRKKSSPGRSDYDLNRHVAARETAARETTNMKGQEYILKALKDAVQMEVEGRHSTWSGQKGEKSRGPEIMEYLRSRKNTTSPNLTRSTGVWSRTRLD